MKHSNFSHLSRWFALTSIVASTAVLSGCLLLEDGTSTTVLDLTEEQIAQIRVIAQDESLTATEVASIAEQVFDDQAQTGLNVPPGPAGAQGPAGPTGPAGTTSWSGLTDIPAEFADNMDDVLAAGSGLSVKDGVIMIDAGAITTAMLADGSVTGVKIADGSVSGAKLEDGSVTASKLALGAIDGGSIDMNTVDTMQLADGSVTTAKLADGSVTAAKIAAGAIDGGSLSNGSIGSDQLGNGSVTNDKLADDSVTSGKLAPGAVDTTALADGNVTSGKLADGAVTEMKLADGSVSGAKIGTGAVTSDKIADGAITTSKLAPNAIDATVLPDDLPLGSASNTPGSLRIFNDAGAETVLVDGDGGDNGELVIRDAAGTPMIIGVAADTGTGEARLQVEGVVDACSSAFGGCDVAEVFELTNRRVVRPGAVMVLDAANPGQLKLSSTPYDTRVAGVISGAGSEYPGVCLGQRHDGSRDLPVALSGRVYVKVDATDAAIEVGDLLTTSGRAGFAMKASDPTRAFGAVLGKAMQPLAKGETGEILVLVALQ